MECTPLYNYLLLG